LQVTSVYLCHPSNYLLYFQCKIWHLSTQQAPLLIFFVVAGISGRSFNVQLTTLTNCIDFFFLMQAFQLY